MKLLISALIFAVVMLCLYAGLAAGMPYVAGEAFADEVAPRTGVDKYLLWDEYVRWAERRHAVRVAMVSMPWAIMAGILAAAIISERGGKAAGGGHSG